jgi:hypothetical protein
VCCALLTVVLLMLCCGVLLLQVRAASDLKALARLIPTEARLVLDPGAEPGAPAAGGSSSEVEYALVQTSSVRPGDILRVLPGRAVCSPHSVCVSLLGDLGDGYSRCRQAAWGHLHSTSKYERRWCGLCVLHWAGAVEHAPSAKQV